MSDQSLKLIARICENLPKIPSEVMQGWIDNPRALQKVLREALCPPVNEVTRIAQKVVKHIIGCDTTPSIPKDWSIAPESEQIESRVRGRLEWDPKKILLWLSESQAPGKSIKRTGLFQQLTGKPVLPANVLDYLLVHPELIPEEWKGKAIFFWGTIYRYSDGNLFVRYLCWLGSWWGWDYDWLGDAWNDGNPAALLASSPLPLVP